MKKILVAAVAISALFAGGAAMAQDDAGHLSYNIAVTSNYVWRGVTQTDNNAALQGGIDYSKGMFYAGAWASNAPSRPTPSVLSARIFPSVSNTRRFAAPASRARALASSAAASAASL